MSTKTAAASYLDNTLQFDDVASMSQAHGLAHGQALIAWFRLLEKRNMAVTEAANIMQCKASPSPMSVRDWFVVKQEGYGRTERMRILKDTSKQT